MLECPDSTPLLVESGGAPIIRDRDGNIEDNVCPGDRTLRPKHVCDGRGCARRPRWAGLVGAIVSGPDQFRTPIVLESAPRLAVGLAADSIPRAVELGALSAAATRLRGV